MLTRSPRPADAVTLACVRPARGVRLWHRPDAPVDRVAFTPDGWPEARAARAGRGNAWFVADKDQALVLRHYLRGGKAALLSRDRYLFTGYVASRPCREIHLLQRLSAAGLPVPTPVGALVERRGLTYAGALLTRTIEGATSLAEKLAAQTLTADDMAGVGACVRRFHAAGVWHADLNANNVLFAGAGSVHLIDFDRGRIVSRGHFAANVARLRRSLDKLAVRAGAAHFDRDLWAAFERGYS